MEDGIEGIKDKSIRELEDNVHGEQCKAAKALVNCGGDRQVQARGDSQGVGSKAATIRARCGATIVGGVHSENKKKASSQQYSAASNIRERQGAI